jgi:hypothetical protein
MAYTLTKRITGCTRGLRALRLLVASGEHKLLILRGEKTAQEIGLYNAGNASQPIWLLHNLFL